MGVFDDILAKAEETDRAVLEKYPELRASVEKLEADSKQLSKDLTDTTAKYKEADEVLTRWENWKAASWDKEKGMTRAEAVAREQLSQIQADYETLLASKESDMTFDETLEQLKKGGHVMSKAEVESMVNQLAGKFVDEPTLKQRQDALAAGFENIFTGAYNLGIQHHEEFGDFLDMKGLLKYMSDHQVWDANKAHAEMMAPKRAEIAAAKDQEREAAAKAAVEEAEKRGYEKARMERVMGEGGQLPVDQAGPGQTMGHLQRARFEGNNEGSEAPTLPDAPLGSGALARAGLEALREGKLGKVVQ